MNLKQIYKNVWDILKKVRAESAELDTAVIIAHILQKDKTFVLSHPEFELGESQKEKILDLANKRSKSVPIAYLTGHKEFFGYDFLVDEKVLIPRPETEFLVEQAIEFIKIKSKSCSALDVGTGSGCIVISLIKSLSPSAAPTLKPLFYATDISEKALDVAKKNAEIHGVQDKITFFDSDLFSNPRLPARFDLIIANLPYVPLKDESEKLKDESISFEPQDAIFADENGAETIKKFIAQSKDRITKDGLILIELDPRNAEEIKKTAEHYFPAAKIETKKDLANHDRYLIIQT